MYKSAGRFHHNLRRRGLKLSSPDRFLAGRSAKDLLAPRVHGGQQWHPPKRHEGYKLDPKPEPKPIKRPETRPTAVYAVRFILRSCPTETFVKIGISSNDMFTRFDADLDNYDIMLIGQRPNLKRRNARVVEVSLHNLFQNRRYRPTVLLKSGNTECFVYDEKLVDQIRNILRWTGS